MNSNDVIEQNPTLEEKLVQNTLAALNAAATIQGHRPFSDKEHEVYSALVIAGRALGLRKGPFVWFLPSNPKAEF